jgi:phenylacetate-CoA ligase
MSLGLSLKYTARHVLKRQPVVAERARDLHAREQLDAAGQRRRQEQLLRETLRAAERIPALADAARRAPASGLAAYLRDAFPVIDKSTLLARRADYYPRRGKARGWWPVGKTSGTTGTPLDVFRGLGSVLWEESFHLQHWHWTGWRTAEPQAVLRGDIVRPAEQREPPFWFDDRAGRQLILSTRHLSDDTVAAFVAAVNGSGARLLRAYPTAAFEFAKAVERQRLSLRFDAVITGSDLLYPFERERIEAVFGARVYNFYGMAERIAFAAECEHGSLHVNPEYSLVEIVDADGQPTDGIGYVAGTSFHNTLMPLVRYRVSDTAHWRHAPCPCGRSYPALEKLTGRTGDMLFDLRGAPVNPTIVSFAFKGLHNIDRAQVAQTARDHWAIRVVPGARYAHADGEALLGNIDRLVSGDVRAEIELVDALPDLDSGKYKWVSQEWRVGGERGPEGPRPGR